MSKLTYEQFGDRNICIKGIGKMFYQDGFPISMAVSESKKKGVEVSIFHVADECLKNGWSAKTTFNKLKADFEEDIDGNIFDLESLEKFCYADYETQREMIFKYLFGTTSSEAKNNPTAMKLFRDKFIESNAEKMIDLAIEASKHGYDETIFII